MAPSLILHYFTKEMQNQYVSMRNKWPQWRMVGNANSQLDKSRNEWQLGGSLFVSDVDWLKLGAIN